MTVLTSDLANALRFDGLAGHPAVAAVRFQASRPLEDASAVICIPARDEAERIRETLRAALDEARPRDGFVIVVNGTCDETAEITRSILSSAGAAYVIADVDWHEGHGSAALARRFALDIAAREAPGAHLVSLDADTRVMPGWRSDYEAAFARGFDLVCGIIDFDPREVAALPPLDAAHEALMRDYRAAVPEIAALIDPDPDNPWPHHGIIGGANFAVRASAYRACGGLPTPPFAEDRALLRRMQGIGARIRFLDGGRVVTSLRLDGRAPGGLAEELTRMRREADPLVDEILEPAERFRRRLTAARAFRLATDMASRRAALVPLALAEADLVAALALPRTGEAWHYAEDHSPVLKRTRMRRSDVARDWPALRALLMELRRSA